LNLEHLDHLRSSLGSIATTRRRAVAGIFAAATGVAVGDLTDAKKKRKRKKRKKSKRKGNSGATIGKPAHVALGAYVPRALYDDSAYDDFTKTIGRTPDYLVWYEDWGNGSFGRDQRTTLATIDTLGLTPVIAWEPFDSDGATVDQPTYRLATIANGNHNAYIDGWADGLAAYGKRVFINFGHEMNGGWSPWGAGVNGNQRGDYIAAWRHIHDRFNARGARNVRWVWVPNVLYESLPATLQDVYPGDSYVDWLGMNGYNWGTSVYWESCPCKSSWESFGKVFDETYHALVALANKPIMIGETASSEKGGNKANWITNGLVHEIPEKYPQIRALTWFHTKATGLDTNKHGQVVPTAVVDWRITSSKQARNAFRKAVANDYYQASLRSLS
jgi:hypothetical protein